MNAGFIQFQPVFGAVSKNIATIERLWPDSPCDLMVLPELSNSGYLFSEKRELEALAETVPDGPFCSFLKRLAASGTIVVSGICEREGDRFYNSSVLVHASGRVDVYRKLHLFDRETIWFTPGDRSLTVTTAQLRSGKEIRLGMMICFDWRFPEVARTLALKGAQIVCHPSNLVMPYAQDAVVTRAIENRIFVITANRIGKDVKPDASLAFTGRSVLVDPAGRIVAAASPDREEVVVVDIDPAAALDKQVTPHNDLFKDRRPEFYR
jgi:predicted amidohydrolase